jgi:hypothetical protein
MSRHVLELENLSLKVHAGFCTAKGSLFAQVYQGESVKPLAAEEFGFFGYEVLANFLAKFNVEVPKGFLEALATDSLDEQCGKRLVLWNELGVMLEEPRRVLQ